MFQSWQLFTDLWMFRVCLHLTVNNYSSITPIAAHMDAHAAFNVTSNSENTRVYVTWNPFEERPGGTDGLSYDLMSVVSYNAHVHGETRAGRWERAGCSVAARLCQTERRETQSCEMLNNSFPTSPPSPVQGWSCSSSCASCLPLTAPLCDLGSASFEG